MSEIEAAINTAIMYFVFDFADLFSGSSIVLNKANFLQVISHFNGGVFLATFVLGAWAFTSLWQLVIAFNMASALVEGAFSSQCTC